ncbi:hypothetical protein I314_04558 [Cryptococcus bacillisporus CA1873]|uniref:Protein YOP1 n=1 Tax=Cryptococcus bacillisporus CA1873 TaxID=1296111 RepID=A0ABR5B843_CRYGA|nr:hypothetical protein I314_04558 [Cryptococcus bacillisporus CA1873]|eukprot:KIR59569.1 hypothetical protein I314_04558 [Cryptococcus gattii CA1873]
MVIPNERLIDYWILYSFSTLVESALVEDTLLDLIPLWWAFKVLAIVWVSFSLSLGGVGAAGASNGAKEKIRPRPLKLRTNSNLTGIPSPAVVKTSQTSYGDIDSCLSSSSSPSHPPSSSSTVISTSYTYPYPGIATGTRAAADRGPTQSTSQLQALRDELGGISAVLSRTPENIRRRRHGAGGRRGGGVARRASAMIEDGNELFGLSKMDRQSEPDSHSGSDS